MKKIYGFLILNLMLSIACENKQEMSTNPFFSEYQTPFKVPPFEQIDTTHYIPAFEKGIAEQQAEIDVIVNNAAAPTFENTILAMDKSGELLEKVSVVFFSLNSAETNPAMQKISRTVTPMMTKHRDNISLNEALFERIKTVYDARESSGLDDQQIRVVEKYYDDFVRNGANLSDEDKEKLRELNQQISANQIEFRENLLAETNENFKLIIDDKKDLSGLPEDVIAAAAEAATNAGLEGRWVFTLQKPSMIPFLQYADNRDLREKLYRGYFMRGNNNDEFDNKKAIYNILKLRAERAGLLGYDNHADYVISNNMAETPEKVYEFLYGIMQPALEMAEMDREEMQKIIDREGGDFNMDVWDWWYYSEKLKKEKYDLDESELKPYFVLNNVRDGMFFVANKLYGLTFTELEDVPVYHEEVQVFEVKNKDGEHQAVVYMDFHPRPGKRVGAWCGRYRQQTYKDGEKIYPVVTMVMNFTRPVGDTPALLTWDEVNTMFHEFGHALHGFFTDGKYERTAGRVTRDMVELPSQIMENWTSQPEVLEIYAKHYQTGEVIPQNLVEKLQNSMKFNEAFNTVEYIAASVLDLDWHTIGGGTELDILTFEDQSMNNINLIKEILPRYRTTYFNHIVGGYAAGYYVYLWAEVLDSDAFQYFVDSGDIFNQEIAESFRKNILEQGGSEEGMVQYMKFRGQEPSIDPLLVKRGLK
jgi:peptidyl-dipeptidase Dcp